MENKNAWQFNAKTPRTTQVGATLKAPYTLRGEPLIFFWKILGFSEKFQLKKWLWQGVMKR